VKISGTKHTIEFEVDDLPEGEYDVRLLIDTDIANKADKKYDLANWKSGIILDPMPAFRREDIYDDDGQ
jgi:hypothetical protein